MTEASHGPDGKRNSLTDNMFQSIDSVRDTEIEVDCHANSNCYQWAMGRDKVHAFRHVTILECP